MHCCSYAKPLAISDAAYYARIKGRVAAQLQWNLPSHVKHIVSAVSSKSHADCSSSAVCNFSDSQDMLFYHLPKMGTALLRCWSEICQIHSEIWMWLWTKWYPDCFQWQFSCFIPCFHCVGAFVCWYSFMHETGVSWASVSVNLLISIKLFMQLILLMKSNFKF